MLSTIKSAISSAIAPSDLMMGNVCFINLFHRNGGDQITDTSITPSMKRTELENFSPFNDLKPEWKLKRVGGRAAFSKQIEYANVRAIVMILDFGYIRHGLNGNSAATAMIDVLRDITESFGAGGSAANVPILVIADEPTSVSRQDAVISKIADAINIRLVSEAGENPWSIVNCYTNVTKAKTAMSWLVSSMVQQITTGDDFHHKLVPVPAPINGKRKRTTTDAVAAVAGVAA